MCLVLSILLYGSECWCLTAANLHQLTVFHRTCVRKMNRVNLYHTWQHHISAEELQSRLGLKDIESYLNTRLLSWVGHIACMSDNRPLRQFLTCWVSHERQSGRPPKTWGARVDEALQYFEIPTDFKDWMELAQDRQKWRKLARGLTDSSEEWGCLCVWFVLVMLLFSADQSIHGCIYCYYDTSFCLLHVLLSSLNRDYIFILWSLIIYIFIISMPQSPRWHTVNQVPTYEWLLICLCYIHVLLPHLLLATLARYLCCWLCCCLIALCDSSLFETLRRVL